MTSCLVFFTILYVMKCHFFKELCKKYRQLAGIEILPGYDIQGDQQSKSIFYNNNCFVLGWEVEVVLLSTTEPTTLKVKSKIIKSY